MGSFSTMTLERPAAGRIAKTVSYYVAFVALGLVSASLGPTLPGLAERTGSVLSEISFLFTARALGYLFGSLQGGRLYDRKPGHPVMAAALSMIAITLFLVPFASRLWLLAAILMVLGMSEGTLDVGGNTLLVWVHRDKVGPFMNGLHFFFGVGAFLSPIIVAQAMLLTGDALTAYWVLAILVLPIVVWLLSLRSPQGHAVSVGEAASRTNSVLVALLALFFFLSVGVEASFGGWIFTYVVKRELSDAASAAYLNSAFWGALTLGRLLAIPLAVRFRPRTLLLTDLVAALACVGIILLWSDSWTLVWIGTFGVGLSIASLFATTMSLAERLLRITGKMTGWFFVGASAGGMTFPWLIGRLFETVGPNAVMFVSLGALGLAIGVLLVLVWGYGDGRG